MKSILITAHRGLSSLYPENTLISFKEAAKLGVDLIELDVRQTKDRKLVIIHDDSIDRTTEGKGKVCQLTLKEIKRYSAGRWFSKKFKEERIPTLSEAFEVIEKRAKILIEIKEPGIEEGLINLIKRYPIANNAICGSFYLESIIRIRKLQPSIPTAFITNSLNLERMKKPLLREGINIVAIDFNHLSLPLLKNCHSYGFVVNAWTINEEKDMKKFLKMGIDIITSNYPQRLKRLLKEDTYVTNH